MQFLLGSTHLDISKRHLYAEVGGRRLWLEREQHSFGGWHQERTGSGELLVWFWHFHLIWMPKSVAAKYARRRMEADAWEAAWQAQQQPRLHVVQTTGRA